MASVNKVILVGYLGKDPETRHTSSGDAICNVSIATTESWRDKASGERKEITEWHKVVFYRKLAEIAGQYLRKGSQVYIEGKIKTRKWQDKDGQDRYSTEIEATDLTMLGSKAGGDSGRSQPQPQQRQQDQGRQGGGNSPGFNDLDDDIPF